MCLAFAVAISLAAPASASAHLGSGTLSTDFEARVDGLRPATAGLAARVLDGDQRLELRVGGSRVVIVLGYIGEPFLRFSPRGVEANLASPTASATRVIKAADAVFSSGVTWRRVTGGHTLAWHENRLRPAPIVHDSATRPHKVATWSIPLLVDGRGTSLTGSEWHAAGPSPWPWLGGGALLIGLAGLLARRARPRTRRRIAVGVLPVAVGGLLAAWCGTFLAGKVTLPTLLFTLVFAGVTGLFLLAGVASARGTAQLGVMALIGAFTAALALPQIVVFGHGFVLSALPALAARLAAAGALVGGVAVAALCMPGVIALLASPSTASR
jgi:hypothetical protein